MEKEEPKDEKKIAQPVPGTEVYFSFYNPPSKIRPGGTEAQQGYSIA